jgi:hypothetical protein
LINSIGEQTACSHATNLRIQGVTDNKNSVKSLAVAQSFNSNNSAHNFAAWSSTGKGSWIQFDLGKEKTICKLLVGFANGNEVINSFLVQTSTDGTHFVNEWSVQNTGMVSGGELFNIPNSPVHARYMKLIFQNNVQGEISNFKVIGSGTMQDGNGGNGGNGGSANGDIGGIGGLGGVGGIGGNAGPNGANGTNGLNGANGTNGLKAGVGGNG